MRPSLTKPREPQAGAGAGGGAGSEAGGEAAAAGRGRGRGPTRAQRDLELLENQRKQMPEPADPRV